MKASITDIHSVISSNIMRIRREKGFTQQEVALEANYSQAFINKIEAGIKFCNLEQLYRIANALDCKVYDLLPDYTIDLDNKTN